MANNIDNSTEIWEEIPGHEKYMISNYGRVMSLVNKRPVILKKAELSDRNYIKLPTKRKKYKNRSIGRIVASVFLREPNEGEILRRIDGNPLNDAADNLEWTDRQERMKGVKFRPWLTGVSNGMARLEERQIIEIRDLKESGKTYNSLAKLYGVSIACIQKIVTYKTWKNI